MTRHTSSGAAFTELALRTFRLNGLLLKAGDALAQPARQSSARWQVMGCVDEEARSVAEIARMMGLARQSVQRTADLLVQDGLAEYRENPAHKRAKLVLLTDKGKRVLNLIEAAQIAWANRLGERVGAKRLERANEVLAQLRELLEADFEES